MPKLFPSPRFNLSFVRTAFTKALYIQKGHLVIFGSFLPYLLPSAFVSTQAGEPMMLLYPESGQLTPSTGFSRMEIAIAE